MKQVLHITPHLGGGVGRALSGLLTAAGDSPNWRHRLVCLEQPEKRQFIDSLEQAGCEVTIAPDDAALQCMIADADIVQLEFWNHPSLIRAICELEIPPLRMVIWCHSSGLHFPALPDALFATCHRFVFTSACSLQAANVQTMDTVQRERLAIISSAGGMERLPLRNRDQRSSLRAGYVGSLNFSKLHPDYVALLSAIADSTLSVRMIGDESNRASLERQCADVGRPGMLDFAGYTTNVMAELAELDILVYLLNPTHYGTAEIALLEAMAMQVVPIVMGNRCEREIVEDGVTGFVVTDSESLAARVKWLRDHEQQRIEMGRRAAAFVRNQFTYARMIAQFELLYADVMALAKCRFDYAQVFGERPSEWFRAFVGAPLRFSDDGSVNMPQDYLRDAMYEQSKGSVYHFAGAFPKDALLLKWRDRLERMR
ncbi:Glycosyltransferase involved in cell wall bisynthesis [Mariprofundus aestuarium]|uniref:Glycosyltransferase involved in cell wall bisynthesis n=1 Tax=Mariprofundus aestuarium TaxID=1921086 RepID=A0A2K8KV44_MARES|nr:glycosyltransferase family 4 protein [Mariprofundus aestuarium]ATX78640.1 Glycosyltransferase involved in cell wall bisynthesis [Mariprofundus aestuarium]